MEDEGCIWKLQLRYLETNLKVVFWVKVVEELLSKSGAMGLEAAKAIADAAMLEVASINVPNMVTMANYQ